MQKLFEKLALILVVATTLATWASFLISLAIHNLEVVSAVAVFILSSIWMWQKLSDFTTPVSTKPIYLVTIVGWLLYLVKLFSQMLKVDATGIWAGGSNVWGDWAGHIGYIANWVYGANWPPQNPWYSGVRLAYPFMFDYLSAILLKLGTDLSWSLQLPGIIFGIVLVILLFGMTHRLTKSSLAAAIAVAVFMLSGGLGFLYLIPNQQILAIPKNGVRELTHSYEANLQWVNFVISEMVPQRGILFGLTAALTIFMLWMHGLEKNDKSFFVLAGVMAGLVPLFHAHTYLALGLISGIYWILVRKRIWWYFFIPALVLGLPQMIYFMPQVTEGATGFTRIQWWWAAHVQNDHPLWFWFKNIGLAAILLPLFWLTIWFKNRKLFWLYLPFVLIFAICNIVIFQPWENDNSKLLRFWYLGSSVLLGWGLSYIATKNILTKILTGILIIGLTLAGAVDAGSWLNYEQNRLQMWGLDDIQAAEFVKANTAKTAVFLTNDNHNHWVVDLAGRKIVLGFRGWLWSWGLNYLEREAEVGQMYRGEGDTTGLFTKYNIDYVIFGSGEMSNFSANIEYYKDNYPLIFDLGEKKIFDVSRN